jgi:carbon-monoxide dehydrogenase large subunit
MKQFNGGQGVRRFEDERLLRGGGTYVDDIELAGMVYGIVVRSPHGHARIKSLDVAGAKSAPGVLAVITALDWERAGLGDLPSHPGLTRRNGIPMYLPRYPVLASDRVRWVGDPVVFVVAETAAQAMDAAEIVSIEYEPLEAVVSTSRAIEQGAPRVYDDCEDNVGFAQSAGDEAAVIKGFAAATHVIKGHFVINRVTAAPMEPRGVVAQFDKGDGRFTVHTPTQRPHSFRAQLAKILQVSEVGIRIVTGDTGGSFGLKSPVFNEIPLACHASKITGRPVKWISTRTEGFLSDAQGRDNLIDAQLALDARGRFLAMRVKVVAAIGAYLQFNMPVFFPNVGSMAGLYRTPAVHVEMTAVFTNTNPVRPYRGNGRPEAAFVIERMVELAARTLRVDSTELRRRNYIAPSQMPFTTGLTFTYDCGEFEKNMDLAMAAANVEGFRKRRAVARKRGKLLGLGISNTIERASSPGTETAAIRFDHTGRATLFAGANSQGQGHETTFKQLAAERLGLDAGHIAYVQGDTDRVIRGEGTGGSRSATMTGSASLLAIDKVIEKAKAIAAIVLKSDPQAVNFDHGVFSTLGSNRTLTWAEVAVASEDVTVSLPDDRPGLSVSATYTSMAANFPNGCHLCEIEIDIETGASRIVRYSVVDDVGTVLNPLLLHGQIHGGVAQGAGQALKEDIRFDDAGQLITASFMDYAMPRAHDLCAITVDSNPVPTLTNPLGVKGAGEAGCVGALPAVVNAIADALSEFEVGEIPMPATSEWLWHAINKGPQEADSSTP